MTEKPFFNRLFVRLLDIIDIFNWRAHSRNPSEFFQTRKGLWIDPELLDHVGFDDDGRRDVPNKKLIGKNTYENRGLTDDQFISMRQIMEWGGGIEDVSLNDDLQFYLFPVKGKNGDCLGWLVF